MIIPFEPPGRARQPGANMVDGTQDQALDHLLAHSESVPDDGFVLQVMHRMQAERRRRRSILLGCGLLGGAFGLFGAWQLAEPVARLFADLSHTGLMQSVLLTCGAAAFYVWFMNEDLGLVN